MKNDQFQIALVEDEPSHSMLVEYNLKKNGYHHIDHYNKGRIFLTNLPSHNYQLVIINVQLFDLDGFTLCHKIREMNRKVPILFLSTDSNCKCKDNIALLEKPFSISDLIGKVEELLNTKQTH